MVREDEWVRRFVNFVNEWIQIMNESKLFDNLKCKKKKDYNTNELIFLLLTCGPPGLESSMDLSTEPH